MIDEAWQFFLVVLVGSAGQLLDGTLGMGFGVFSASMLVTAGFPPVSVVATVNTAKILTGIFSGLAHWRAGNVRSTWLLPLVVPGVIGGVLGARLLISLPQDRFRFWMAVVLVTMGFLILSRCLFPGFFFSRSAYADSYLRVLRGVGLAVLGLVAGVLNAASGAYGPIATSGVMLITNARTSRAVGTVNFAEVVVAGAVVFTFFSHKGLETASWDLALALILGGVLTAPLAANVCRRLPPKILQVGVGVALISLNVGILVSEINW